MQCSPYSCLENIKTSCNPSGTSMWTVLYHLNNIFLFISILINLILSCNTNARKHTSISQYLVDESKHVSVLYSAVQKASLAFSYGLNCITITKALYISHIHMLCTEKCKWHIECNSYTKTRIPTGLHVLYSVSFVLPPHYYEVIFVVCGILF